MSQIGEASYDPPEATEQKNRKEHIKIRFDIFNDGTLNNRTNIDARLVTMLAKEGRDKNLYLTDEERSAALELQRKMSADQRQKAVKAYQKHGAPPPSESENSYEGYYTNIVRMERNVDIAPGEGFQYSFKAYIEGVGSEDLAGDEMFGYAFGSSFLLWRAGILEKVEKGIVEMIKQIIEQVKNKERLIIDEIVVAVYGFSRGAAVARKLIHELLFGGDDEERRLQSRLERQGFSVTKVTICFAGLFDTVSTYASDLKGVDNIRRGIADNVAELNLYAVVNAEESLQLAAADEHRFHFSLTTIESAYGKGKQFFLPGVHSDIGGGYRDAGSEKNYLLGNVGLLGFALQGSDASQQEMEADMQQLIAAGWYRAGVPGREDEIKIENNDYYIHTESGAPQLVERRALLAQRSNISNGYSQIPLQIMARYARDKGLLFKPRFDDDEAISELLHGVRDRIDNYIANIDKSRARDWHHNEPWLRALRHRYLHFSARMKAGYAPRVVDGKRIRMTYDG